jgi:hypothetical protein
VTEPGEDERSVEGGGDDTTVDCVRTTTALKSGVEPGEPDDGRSWLVKRALEAKPHDLVSAVELKQLSLALLGAQAKWYGWALHAWLN